MGKFSAGIKAAQGVEAQEDTLFEPTKPEDQQSIKPEDQQAIKPEDQQAIKPEDQQAIKPEDHKTRKMVKAKQEEYSMEDRKLVNVGGFKVPQVVRQHWKAQSAVQAQAIAPMLTDCLIEAFGLPQGMSREQFEALVTEGRKG